MKKLLLLLLLLPFFVNAQYTPALPSGYTPFATQMYYKIVGSDTTFVEGATGRGFHVIVANWPLRDSLLTYAKRNLSNVNGILLGANGGTGIANTGKTITLGGNLTTSGSFASTFTMTGTTTVTFPTTGTLATTANLGSYLPLAGGTMSAPIVFSGTTVGVAGTRWIGSDGGTGLTINGATATSISLSIGNAELINIVPGTVTVKAGFATTGAASITGASPQLTINKSGGGSNTIQVNTDNSLQLGSTANVIISSAGGLLYVPTHVTPTGGFLAVETGSGNLVGYRTAAEVRSDISAQTALSGTGFVKISGTTISYDNSTYLTTASASSTYLPLSGGTLTGSLSGTTGNFNSATGSMVVTTSGASTIAVEATATGNSVAGSFTSTASSFAPLQVTQLGASNIALFSNSGGTKIAFTNDGSAWFSGTLGINGVTDNIKSGTYTPTITGITNVASAGSVSHGYLRVGNQVYVYGKINIDPTTAGTDVIIDITLPIASDFTNIADAAGSGSNSDWQNTILFYAEVTNNKLRGVVIPTSAANADYYYTFGYQVK